MLPGVVFLVNKDYQIWLLALPGGECTYNLPLKNFVLTVGARVHSTPPGYAHAFKHGLQTVSVISLLSVAEIMNYNLRGSSLYPDSFISCRNTGIPESSRCIQETRFYHTDSRVDKILLHMRTAYKWRDYGKCGQWLRARFQFQPPGVQKQKCAA